MGKIYDELTTVKGARIYNETQNTIEFSNDDGEFTIEAKIGDSITIGSLFHNKFNVIVEQIHLNGVFVFELTKFTNELDAVEIIKREDKKFDGDENIAQVNEQIQNDVKSRDYLYNLPPSGNMDFIAIAQLIGKLFKKKNRPEEIVLIEPENLKMLFENDSLFTQKLLLNDLQISKKYQFLYFEYCSAQNIDSKLLDDNNEMELLELLLIYSAEFNQIIKNTRKD